MAMQVTLSKDWAASFCRGHLWQVCFELEKPEQNIREFIL
jgi:hypothetical protein